MEVPESSITVLGRSMGTLPALHLARSHPQIGGIIIDSGLYSPLRHFAEVVRRNPAFSDVGEADILATELGKELAADRAALASFAGSVTLLHCADDDVLAVGDADVLFDEMARARSQHETSEARFDGGKLDGEGEAFRLESGGTLRVAGNARLLRFDCGGHNFIFQMNWARYAEAVFSVMQADAPATNAGAGESPGVWWKVRMEQREGEGALESRGAGRKRRGCNVM
mmetsp:Transcript_35638/g.61601  ORF Transcript_35638/g.61601 Transcript_35638/m.61601 type:complete len:227 (+) Transcript_35638:518-1198(+)